MAWLLTTCPDRSVWNPDRALEYATKAIAMSPNEGGFWNTLGVAQYRAGQCKEAVITLSKSMELRSGGTASDWFFLAMAHKQLGNQEEARQWYDKAVAWTQTNKPDDAELRRFQAEAAALLGVTPPDCRASTRACGESRGGEGTTEVDANTGGAESRGATEVT